MFNGGISLFVVGAALVLSLTFLAPRDAVARFSLREAVAQVLPAPPAYAPPLSPPKLAETATRIVAVEWRIRKGQEEEFLEYWSTRASISDRSGLVGEFLNRVESRDQFPWMVWELGEGWTTFINVGIWREGADFQQQVGRFIDNASPPLAFEADRRRRVFLAPERWRIGQTPLLHADHAAVQ